MTRNDSALNTFENCFNAIGLTVSAAAGLLLVLALLPSKAEPTPALVAGPTHGMVHVDYGADGTIDDSVRIDVDCDCLTTASSTNIVVASAHGSDS